MAIRPVFIAEPSGKFAYTIANVEFPWFGGFARVQKEKCIHALHEAYLLEHREAKILEISSYSQEPLGQQLSAFHLKFQAQNGLEYPVECIFQSSKIFENGSQYAELRSCSPREAKKDPRLKSSGPLKSFSLDSCIFPLEPKTFFYNWVYI